MQLFPGQFPSGGMVVGKVTKFTGSKLLGAELRRLRGGRSLKQISELSRTPPLSERVGPVAAPTLSQIENGISFPSLETIHSLAQIYRRPVQQLLDLVVQERLDETTPVGEPGEPSLERFTQLQERGELHAAYLEASQGERATSGAESLTWRANRAQVLQSLGFVQDCITVMEECLDHPDLHADRAHFFHQALAAALAHAGLYRSASLHQEAAVRLAPAELSPELRLHLALSRAHLVLATNEESAVVDGRSVREAIRALDDVAARVSSASAELEATITIHRAWGLKLLGNAAVAVKDLTAVIATARNQAMPRVLMDALCVLGTLHRESGRTASAVRALEEAAGLAADSQAWDSAFDLQFELYRTTQSARPDRAALHLRRCERYYPLLNGRTPNMVRYEAVGRGE